MAMQKEPTDKLSVDQKLDRILELLESRRPGVAEVSAIVSWLAANSPKFITAVSIGPSDEWTDMVSEFVETALSHSLQIKFRHLEKVHVYPDKEIQRAKLVDARR
jgi:hypothetical protein